MNDLLERSLAERRRLRSRFSQFQDEDIIDGIVIRLTSQFVAIRQECDFELDGTVVLSREAIKGVRDNEFDECCNRILKLNGFLLRVKPSAWLNQCTTLGDLLSSLRRKPIWPGVSTRPKRGKRFAYYLGPLTEVREDTFKLWCFDAKGCWEKEYELSIAAIRRIEFGTRYCRHFSRYMRSQSEDAE